MKHKNYFYQIVVGIFSAMVLSTSHAQTNVFDDVIATSPDHNYLEAALVQQGLDVALQTTPNITVFAPTDQAFTDIATALGTDINGLLALPNLTDILTYHVLGSVVPSTAVTNGLIAQPLSTTNTVKLTVTSGGEVFINQAQVTAVDLTADNGVVHVTNGVILPNETVVDVAIDNGFNALASAVVFAEVMPSLTNPLANYTVFAPTDQAFEDLASWVGVSLEDLLTPEVTPPGFLADILFYHVLGAPVLAAELSNGAIVAPLSTTNDLKVTVKSSGDAFVNQAQITSTDIASDNGVVHVIDGVLINFETVVDVAIDNGFTTLASAVITAELLPALTDPYNEFTVFAPTNDAFDALAVALNTDLNGILALPNLAEVLLYHVVDGFVASEDLSNGPVTTLSGTEVSVDLTSGVMINNSNVTTPDVFADNGIVHIIDAVLLPPTTNVNEIESIAIDVYPNPATDNLYISSESEVDFYITDLKGNVLKRGTTGTQVVSVSDLSSGAYLVRAAGQVHKFMKN